ncbi:MAG: NUDIX hydrolase [Candidatus Synoicihabitans palmerolidicus]|nr:NUDIX hydrolase [Candidatus Synoicihabitans palmerolidicus]
MSQATPSPAPWRRGADQLLLRTRVFDVRSSQFQHPARSEGKEFLVIDAPDWAVVLAVTSRGELVLVKQFRFGVERLSLELPGGVVEQDESALQAASRELVEETGYRGDSPILLGSVHPNPAIQSNRAHVVLINNVERTEATQWDADEELGLSLRPVDEVLTLGRAGGITHALMLNALFWLEPWWRANRSHGLLF